MRRAGLALAAAVLGLAVAPGEALACACCTNPGQRYVDVETLDSGRLEEIERVRFGTEARLYVGAGGVETIKGIQNPAERYDSRSPGTRPIRAKLASCLPWQARADFGHAVACASANHLDLRNRPARRARSGHRSHALQGVEVDGRGHGHRRVQPDQQSEAGVLRSFCKEGAIPAPAPPTSRIGPW